MPLISEEHKPWLENGFWLVVLALVYVGMMKVMHPGWTIFGF